MAPITLNINTTIQDIMKEYGQNAKGKTYIITGPSVKSIGAAVAQGLASGGPKCLILVGRSEAKIKPVIDAINAANASISVHFVEIDLLSLASVKQGANEIQTLTSEIHGLVNCAGIMAPQKYVTSADGIESQFATNHIAHFYLTNLLMAELKKGSGVVVNVSSGGYEVGDVDFEDPNFQDGKTYNGWAAYGQSKTANVLFTVGLDKRTRKFDMVSFAINPGYVAATGLQASTGITPEFFMEGYALQTKRNGGVPGPMLTEVTAEQGAGTIAWALLDPELRKDSGSWLHECQIQFVKPYATDPEGAEKLWHLSERLVGQTFDV